MQLIPNIIPGKVDAISADYMVKLNGLIALEYHMYNLSKDENIKYILSDILDLHNHNKIPIRFYS